MGRVPTGEYIPPADVAAYADTGKPLAGARFYDTEHGIEVAGIMAPGTTEEDAARLRMCDISPDWRPMESLPYGDQLECVAMLAVNMSGFNLGLVASGEPKGNLKVSWDANGNIAAMTGLPVATPKATAEHAEMAELREMVDVLMADYTERRKVKAMAAFS